MTHLGLQTNALYYENPNDIC